MYRWTYELFRKEVKKNLQLMKAEFFIDVTGTTKENALEVVKWAKKDKLKAELKGNYVVIRVLW